MLEEPNEKRIIGDNKKIIHTNISFLFSEAIAIWMISTWELFGKPKNFHIIELGPGDGSLTNTLLRSFKKFPEFNSIKKIFLYEESEYLKKIQKKNILCENVNWINNFTHFNIFHLIKIVVLF